MASFPFRSTRQVVLGGLALGTALVAGWLNAQSHGGNVEDAVEALSPHQPIIAAAGDIACSTADIQRLVKAVLKVCQMQETSDLLMSQPFAAVLALGDLQYVKGELSEFRASYDRTWGRVKAITKPVPGNHEYYTPGAVGYYQYFGAIAQDPQKGYYSYDIGRWHIIALNSNCEDVGCDANSPQVQWLKSDLATHRRTKCTLAYWHHPRFSSGLHSNNAATDIFWRELYTAGAEIILTGHDHNYERFAPQSPDAQLDPKRGIRQFVVGTGGSNLRPFGATQPNSEVRNSDSYGVLKLTLKPNRYDWEFLPIQGQAFTDSGSTACHR